MDYSAEDEPESMSTADISNRKSVLIRLYASHFLSYWNSRAFEFGAVLFLAAIFPDSLLYASIYALGRSLAGTLLSSRVGSYVDRSGRLRAIRNSIIWQRTSVAASCGLFLLMLSSHDSFTLWICFPTSVILACFEKLAAIGNTVAVERDWVIVVADATGTQRAILNATVRRIDLICKLLAPVAVALIDAYWTTTAIWAVLVMNTCSAFVEHFAIAQVYSRIPELAVKELALNDGAEANLDDRILSRSWITANIEPWREYFLSPTFLASFSLSLLYLTVLSTGVHWQTYMLSLHFSGLSVAIFRMTAVISELSATLFAPMLMRRIGPIRSGLWSINWQVAWLALAVVAFLAISGDGKISAAALTTGIVMSRMGLWGIDLSVQFIVQESVPADVRGRFSSCEMALQNFWEMLSFVGTIVFSRPDQFRYPALVSFCAVAISAACFAAFVRKERGHLIHLSQCLGGEKDRYRRVPDEEESELRQLSAGDSRTESLEYLEEEHMQN